MEILHLKLNETRHRCHQLVKDDLKTIIALKIAGFSQKSKDYTPNL